MAPSAVTDGVMTNGVSTNGVSSHEILFAHDHVHFDPNFKPKSYNMKGTPANSKILIENVNILDSTGKEPYRGDVYIEGERIHDVGTVPNKNTIKRSPGVRVVQGRGRTLMSGLGDAHAHFTWNNGDLGRLGELGVEEHTLLTARSAQCYIDSGYTMCYGAASAKDRLDCVVRDAINNGDLPGPRYLANGKEMAVPDGELVPGITAFAKGPLEMREVIRHHIKLGVDNIKLSMSGEQICETRDAQDCYYTDEETAACVDEAHRHGIRLCAHARARDSVKMCVRHGVDIIYHASWTDDEGMDMLEKNKHKHMVAPGINWLIATIYEAAAFGYPFEKAEQAGYKAELDNAVKVLRDMHRRGITVLPGGDYGFAWTPHGTYARDLEHFVKLLGFTPMESIVAATAGVAKLFMRDELGKILPGYFADCILVDGDPLKDISVLQDHDKLNIIIVNGRIHKASYKEFLRPELQSAIAETAAKMTNFVAYELTDGTRRTRIGHLDQERGTITPIAFASGTPVSNLYEVFEVGYESLILAGDSFPASSVKHLPPISGRDVLAVGKNYVEHAKEFNKSGYDSSDKVDMPTHPVIFTKRATSIVAHGEDILLHEGFTSTLDYEGEIGVIIGKPGFQIEEKDADEYVWGYTIINDVTAREKQRDHKQFYIGKSADTFCPIGPVAVPKEELPKVLKVETRVNGELRQQATTEDLIFSVPNLIKTLSESQTLQPGDVIATGTPAGVGFGLTPPQFLMPGDLVEISVTGLGTLRNKVAERDAKNPTLERSAQASRLPIHNLSITNGGVGLTELANGKNVYIQEIGESTNEPVIFVHGSGSMSTYFQPLITAAKLKAKYRCILYDLEGHGLSPTKATSVVSIQSMADDLQAIIKHLSLNSITVVAHSMGCLVAETSVAQNPTLFKKLVLVGPPPSPLPQAAREGAAKRAAAVRASGMVAVAEMMATNGTSSKTQETNPLAFTAVLQSLLAQDPEGYAKGCGALAGATNGIDVAQIKAPTLIVTGDNDQVSPPAHVQQFVKKLSDAKAEILRGVGHWHGYEDVNGLAKAVAAFL